MLITTRFDPSIGHGDVSQLQI